MSQEQTTPKLPNDPPETVVETDPNDAAQIVESQANQPAQDKADDDGPPPKFTDDARNAIFKNADGARRKVGEFKPQTESRPAFQGHEDPIAVTQAEQVITQAEQSQATTEDEDLEDAALDRYVTKVVNGQKQRVKVRDLVANAQIDDAATLRLNQAKELQAENRRIFEELRRMQQPSPTAEPTEASHPDQARAIRREELKRIAEKLRMGDDEEAVEALDALDARAGTSTQVQMSPEEVEARVLEKLEEKETLKELRQFGAGTGFDFTKSKALQAEMTVAATAEMAADLLKLGLPQDIVENADGNQIREAFRRAQQHGAEVRSKAEIFKASHTKAYENIRKTFNIPQDQTQRQPVPGSANPAPQPNRVELKRNAAQPPARRQTPTAPPVSPPSPEANRAAALVKMRQARHQPV